MHFGTDPLTQTVVAIGIDHVVERLAKFDQSIYQAFDDLNVCVGFAGARMRLASWAEGSTPSRVASGVTKMATSTKQVCESKRQINRRRCGDASPAPRGRLSQGRVSQA